MNFLYVLYMCFLSYILYVSSMCLLSYMCVLVSGLSDGKFWDVYVGDLGPLFGPMLAVLHGLHLIGHT